MGREEYYVDWEEGLGLVWFRGEVKMLKRFMWGCELRNGLKGYKSGGGVLRLYGVGSREGRRGEGWGDFLGNC